MALIGKIREKTQLLVIVVSLGLIFFIARELVGLSPSSFSRTPIIGIIAGQKITLRDFQDHLEKLQRNFFFNYEEAPSEEYNAYLRKQAWQQLLDNILYTKVVEDLGLVVTEDELVDMVQGEHIHPDLKAAFSDLETKEFNKKDLIAYLQNLSQLPAVQQMQWHNFEKNLSMLRCQIKFNELMKQSVFVTNLEAQYKFNVGSTSVDIQYVYIPYSSIKDEDVALTDTMLKNYLQEHANDYQLKEAKAVRYINFPILASEDDKIAFQKELEALKQDFAKTEEDSLFASIHTDTNPALCYLKCTEQDLPTPLVAQKNILQKGAVTGPLAEGDSYKLYKITRLTLESPKKYEISIIEQNLTPSDETKEEAFKQADDFARKVKNKVQFDAQASRDTLTVYEASVSKDDVQVGKLTHARELVRWLYNENEAKVGKVSPIFELADNYVVTVLVEHTKACTAPLDKVRNKVKRKVINEEKSKIITKKLQPITTLPLDSLALQYGNEARTFTAQQVKFNTHTLPGLGTVDKAISQAFALQSGQRSKIISDSSGIIVLDVVQHHLTAMPDSWQGSQAEQIKLEQFKQSYQIPKALEKLANTRDFRYKYY